MSRVLTEWYDRWAEFDCPTCDRYFGFKFQQHEHAEKTGHKKAKHCKQPHPKGRGYCQRAKGHGGWHAYPGSAYVVIWVDNKDKKETSI